MKNRRTLQWQNAALKPLSTIVTFTKLCILLTASAVSICAHKMAFAGKCKNTEEFMLVGPSRLRISIPGTVVEV